MGTQIKAQGREEGRGIRNIKWGKDSCTHTHMQLIDKIFFKTLPSLIKQ